MAEMSSDVAQLIDAMSEAFVRLFNIGKVDQLVKDFYAEDASLLPPDHEMVSGQQRVCEAIQVMIDTGMGDLSMETVKIEVSGDLAYRIGRYTMGKPGPDRGKFIEVHRRQPDGSWRCTADSFNSDGTHD